MYRHLCNDVITAVFTVIFVLGVKIIYLIDSTKISNFFRGGKEIVTSMYSSLEGQRQRKREKQQDLCKGLHEWRHGTQLYLNDSQWR